MMQNLKNSGNATNRLFSQLAAEKKKGLVALCLIALMGFMWVRVLMRKTPKSADAAVRQEGVKPGTSGSNSQLKISFIELPKVAGRNDVLTRDFFIVDDWQDFIDGEGGNLGGNQEVSVVSGDGNEEVVRRVAEKLKLEAIVSGENRQAVVNDKLLSVGDKLLVKDGVDTYECEVVGIEVNTVFIRFGEAEIRKKLTQTSITDY